MIQIQDLTKIYRVKKKDIVAINNVNLTIEKGDIFGIIGLSGAGKSTLIRCINYLEKPTSGEVIYKGTALSCLKSRELREIRKEIGMIFQGFNLLEQRTVLKNILFPLELAKVSKEAAMKRARELLRLVGLEDKENAYPSQLSGGQKQRVAIARALANQPSVLLCDEATSALDPNTTESILHLLKDINQQFGITIILITHEMQVIEKICTKVAIIDESKIQETGSIAEIFSDPKTSIAKSFIFKHMNSIDKSFGKTLLRLTFQGNEKEPIIANLILETKVGINIVEASIQKIENQSVGTMIIQLPEDEIKMTKVKQYLKRMQVSFEEEVAK
ncbi:MAG: ATP-binding cassette domain-containing protein [Anaeroplasmataceae bacterium]|nr:ATP-binding cassette domain-containing protein [Anaeroplasmataceae bacterium]